MNLIKSFTSKINQLLTNAVNMDFALLLVHEIKIHSDSKQ